MTQNNFGCLRLHELCNLNELHHELLVILHGLYDLYYFIRLPWKLRINWYQVLEKANGYLAQALAEAQVYYTMLGLDWD